MVKMPDIKLEEQKEIVEEIVEELDDEIILDENMPDLKDIEPESPFEEFKPNVVIQEKEEPNLFNLNKKALFAICKERGIKKYSKLTKSNLIKIINGEYVEPAKIEVKVEKKPVVIEPEPEPVKVEEVEEPVVEIVKKPKKKKKVVIVEESESESEEEEIVVVKKKRKPKKKVDEITSNLIKERPIIQKQLPLQVQKPLHNPFRNLYNIN